MIGFDPRRSDSRFWVLKLSVFYPAARWRYPSHRSLLIGLGDLWTSRASAVLFLMKYSAIRFEPLYKVSWKSEMKLCKRQTNNQPNKQPPKLKTNKNPETSWHDHNPLHYLVGMMLSLKNILRKASQIENTEIRGSSFCTSEFSGLFFTHIKSSGFPPLWFRGTRKPKVNGGAGACRQLPPGPRRAGSQKHGKPWSTSYLTAGTV